MSWLEGRQQNTIQPAWPTLAVTIRSVGITALTPIRTTSIPQQLPVYAYIPTRWVTMKQTPFRPPLLGTEEWSETDHFEWNINSDRCSESGETDYNLHTTTTMTLQTGGKGVAGRQNLVEIDIGATAYLSFPYPYPTRSTKTGPLKWFQEMKSLLMAKQQMPMARFLPCCQTTRRWILHREPRRNVTPIRSGQANITRICRCLFVSRIQIIQTMRMIMFPMGLHQGILYTK